jgi:hypothetical protein
MGLTLEEYAFVGVTIFSGAIVGRQIRRWVHPEEKEPFYALTELIPDSLFCAAWPLASLYVASAFAYTTLTGNSLSWSFSLTVKKTIK